MNLRHLTDRVLLEKIDLLVQSERELLSEILHHLREVDRRKLFSSLRYSSLHDYAIRHLRYSADQADRRVKAMRLLRDLPEIEEAIDSGKLTLTHLGLLQSAFKGSSRTGPLRKASCWRCCAIWGWNTSIPGKPERKPGEV